jgi:hypothetical protein
MTVAELIKTLSKFDPNTPVMLAHPEFGFDSLIEIHEIEAVDADHGEAAFVSPSQDGHSPHRVKAICLGPVEQGRVEEHQQAPVR